MTFHEQGFWPAGSEDARAIFDFALEATQRTPEYRTITEQGSGQNGFYEADYDILVSNELKINGTIRLTDKTFDDFMVEYVYSLNLVNGEYRTPNITKHIKLVAKDDFDAASSVAPHLVPQELQAIAVKDHTEEDLIVEGYIKRAEHTVTDAEVSGLIAFLEDPEPTLDTVCFSDVIPLYPSQRGPHAAASQTSVQALYDYLFSSLPLKESTRLVDVYQRTAHQLGGFVLCKVSAEFDATYDIAGTPLQSPLTAELSLSSLQPWSKTAGIKGRSSVRKELSLLVDPDGAVRYFKRPQDEAAGNGSEMSYREAIKAEVDDVLATFKQLLM